MKSVLCLAVVAALFVGCGGDSDPPSGADLEESRQEMTDILRDGGATADDFQERADWLSDMPEDERADVIREDFEFGLSMMGVSSPVVEGWSNDEIIEYAGKVCEAMEGAGDIDQYIMSLSVIVAGYDLNAYEDQIAASTLGGAASQGWCFDEAERLGLVDAALGTAPETALPASEPEFDETASAGELDQAEADLLKLGGATDEHLACVTDRLAAEQVSFDYLTDDPPDYGDGFDAAFTVYAAAVADCLPPEVNQAILADPIPDDCFSETLASLGVPYSDFLRWLTSSNSAGEFLELDAAIEECG